MWHKPCRTFHPWCPCIKTRCLWAQWRLKLLASPLFTTVVNTLKPSQDVRHFPDDILKSFFLNEKGWISIKISLKVVPRCPINNIPALVQIMAWRRPGDKPLSEAMVVRLLTHICATRLQWVKTQIKENIKAPRHWLLWGESAGGSEWWFPSQRASNAKNVCIKWRHHIKMRLQNCGHLITVVDILRVNINESNEEYNQNNG